MKGFSSEVDFNVDVKEELRTGFNQFLFPVHEKY